MERLREISNLEDITIDDDALYEIARLSDGGMRDAINFLDQLVAYSNDNITIDDVYKVNGSVSYEELYTLLDDVKNNNKVKLIEFVDYLDESGNASRILGMGDILSIVEQVQSEIDEKEAEKTAKKMMKGNFDLEDFLNQLNQIKKLGPLENLLKLLPGAKKMGLNNVNIDPKIMKRTEAIVLSMTLEERRDPSILKASRKKRIADGSGTTVTDVNKLLNQFEEMKKMMKMMGNGNFKMPF